MLKNISVISWYSFLIYQFNTGKSAAFMMLFSLLFELLLITLIFVSISLLNKKDRNFNRVSSIFIGSIPVFLFQYFIACCISLSLNEYPEKAGELNFSTPIIFFKTSIVLTMVALSVSYVFNVIDFTIKKSTVEVIEKAYITQVLLISSIGLAGIIFLSAFNDPNTTIILSGMAIMRISFEFLIGRKMVQLYSK